MASTQQTGSSDGRRGEGVASAQQTSCAAHVARDQRAVQCDDRQRRYARARAPSSTSNDRHHVMTRDADSSPRWIRRVLARLNLILGFAHTRKFTGDRLKRSESGSTTEFPSMTKSRRKSSWIIARGLRALPSVRKVSVSQDAHWTSSHIASKRLIISSSRSFVYPWTRAASPRYGFARVGREGGRGS